MRGNWTERDQSARSGRMGDDGATVLPVPYAAIEAVGNDLNYWVKLTGPEGARLFLWPNLSSTDNNQGPASGPSKKAVDS